MRQEVVCEAPVVGAGRRTSRLQPIDSSHVAHPRRRRVSDSHRGTEFGIRMSILVPVIFTNLRVDIFVEYKQCIWRLRHPERLVQYKSSED